MVLVVVVAKPTGYCDRRDVHAGGGGCAFWNRAWQTRCVGWAPVLLFTGAIALPAIVLVPQGFRSAAFLVLRAETAATLSALLVLTTHGCWCAEGSKGSEVSDCRGGDPGHDLPLHF